MKLAWATDIHIDHCKPRTQRKFFNSINESGADIVLLSGDISQTNYIERDFELIGKNIAPLIFFVLGNHDFFYGGFEKTKKLVRGVCDKYQHMTYLSDGTIFHISDKTAIIGGDGWYDGLSGNPNDPKLLQLNDFYLIDDINYVYGIRTLFFEKLNQLGKEWSVYFQNKLREAFDTGINELILVTHVPPFAAASLFMGKPSEPHAAPFFSCQTVGDMLIKEMAERPDKKLLVLAGHTHDKAEMDFLPNLKVIVGYARYGSPTFQIFEKL